MLKLNELKFGLVLLLAYVQCQKEIPNCNYTFVEKSCRSDQTPFWSSGNAPVELIIGGTPYKSAEYPFLVSFYKTVKEPTALQEGCYQHFCGGTLIAPNLILTAAHCFSQIRLVGPQATLPSEVVYVSISPQCRHLVSQERIFVDQIFIHPEYQSPSLNNDIAIVSLLGKYSGTTAEIDDGSQDFTGSTDLTTIGYGTIRPEEQQLYTVQPLQGAKLKMIPENLCKEFLDSTSNQQNQDNKKLSDSLDYKTMVCAYNQKADTCEGDSGGPLLYNNKIVGVVSWGPYTQCSGLGDIATPGVFTRVSQFQSWISQTLKDHSIGAPLTPSGPPLTPFVTGSPMPQGVVVGQDDLTLINTTDNFPYRIIGFFEKQGCTGSLINPRIVLTAASCIYDRFRGEYFKDFSFSPGYNGTGVQPFGVMEWSEYRLPSEYLDEGNPDYLNYDYGIIVLKESYVDVCNARGFDDCNRFLEIDEACTSHTTFLSNTGYRTEGDMENDLKMWTSTCDDVAIDCSVSQFQHTCDSTSGMVGAPLWEYRRPPGVSQTIVYINSAVGFQLLSFIRGIHVGAISSNGTLVNQAITINDDVRARITQWASDVGISFLT